jgi:hypothetical protein
MKIEVMTGKKFDKVVKELHIGAECVYRTPKDDKNKRPYYEIWEIDKSDMADVEVACMSEKVLFCHSKGDNSHGTPFEALTIAGKFIIGWTTVSGEDTFDNLTSYFNDGLGTTNPHEICACAVTMAKNNGMSFIDLWKNLEV